MRRFARADRAIDRGVGQSGDAAEDRRPRSEISLIDRKEAAAGIVIRRNRNKSTTASRSLDGCRRLRTRAPSLLIRPPLPAVSTVRLEIHRLPWRAAVNVSEPAQIGESIGGSASHPSARRADLSSSRRKPSRH